LKVVKRAVEGRIRTVLGDIDPRQLGITLMHEHVFADMCETWDEDHCLVDFETQCRELGTFVSQGGKSVVDQTNRSMGRRPKLLTKLARKLEIHIIASTGFYREPWIAEEVRAASIYEITEIMVKEIEDGMDDLDVRAGSIGEIGSSEFGTSPAEEKVLRAAGRAHLLTGAPIVTHTMGGAEALRQIELLHQEGVDMGRVLISHLDLDHLEHLVMVARHGVYMGFDTAGKARYRSDDARLELLCRLVEAGYEDRVCVSHDISRKSYLASSGGHGYGHLLGTFMERVQDRLGEDVTKKLLVSNPSNFLGFHR
jgi:predicted metal-dependent phosphotriesterase family hydrolase